MAVPQNKKSDFVLRKDIKRLVRRIRRTLRGFNHLNDPIFVLGSTRTVLKKQLAALEAALKAPITAFLASKKIDILVEDAHRDFVKSLSDFIARGTIKIRDRDTRAIVSQIKGQYSDQFDNVITEMITRQDAKFGRFQASAETASLPAVRQLETQSLITENAIIEVKRGSRTIRANKKMIDDIWKNQSLQSGDTGHILYQDARSATGVRRFPLVTWAEGRLDTITQDTHRLTQLIDAAFNGVWTVRVSRHGSIDDCLQSEGEILFINAQAKTAAIRDFPGQGLESLRTVQDAEADGTHIFGFRCRHIVTAVPINLMNNDDRQDELAKMRQTMKENQESLKKVRNADVAA